MSEERRAALSFLIASAFIGLIFVQLLILAIWTVALRFPRVGGRVRWLLDAHIRATVDYTLGDIARARASIELAGPSAPRMSMWICNIRLIVLIAGGHYREAVFSRPALKTRAAMRVLRNTWPTGYGLLAINRAEALYNLGRWQRAERLMNAVVAAGLCDDATNSQGGAAQLAWIWANQGDLKAAAFVAERLDVNELPRDYRAEAFFTRAFIAIKSGDAKEALQHLDQAQPHLRRASSERNELFLRAWAMELQGDDVAAASLYERASTCVFRGQGGDGLLRWGDLLARRGDAEGARKAWALAIERDEESESAKTARARLSGPDVPA